MSYDTALLLHSVCCYIDAFTAFILLFWQQNKGMKSISLSCEDTQDKDD